MYRALLFVLAVAACATPKQAAPGARTATGNNDDVVCHEVTDTGTLFSHTECTTREDEDQEREDTRRTLQRPHGTNSGQQNGSPMHH